MRSTLSIGVLVALCGSAAPARAQTFPVQATVSVPRVEVRSGPTDKLYPTSELHQGETVVVLRECKEQPGWLEIRPPDGSFNWINAKSVKEVSPTDVLVDDQAAASVLALVGSEFKVEPNKQVKHGYLPGSILHVAGTAHKDGVDTWIAVQPDSRDVRVPSRQRGQATDGAGDDHRAGDLDEGRSTDPGHSRLPQRQRRAQAAGQHDVAIADAGPLHHAGRAARHHASRRLEHMGLAANDDIPRERRPADVRARELRRAIRRCTSPRRRGGAWRASSITGLACTARRSSVPTRRSA